VLADLLALTVPHEDIDEVLALSRTIDRRLLEPYVSSLLDHMGSFQRPPRLEPLAGQHPFFYVMVFLEVLPHVREYHRAHGISETDSRVILADLGRHLAGHRHRFGRPGVDPPNWLNFAFRGMIYQLGRLQFERVPIDEQMSQSMTALGYPCAPTDLALSVHIPDFCGPLEPQAVDDALRLAVGFFDRHFPSERYDFAICHSWLLVPQLAAHLRPESNIMRFQHRFMPAYASENNDTFLRFVYPDTRLRAIVQERIGQGESWLAGSGFLRLPR
jgi:GNAT-like C-terminal domain/N-acyltransferase N-terminal domain